MVGSMTDMTSVKSETVDAVLSACNIEQLYPYEVPIALAEFLRVLKPDGFVFISCPDLQSVAALITEDKLVEPAYISPTGRISPLDVLYGHRWSMRKGNLYKAQKCSFTQRVLANRLQSAGFIKAATKRRSGSFLDLWAVASKKMADDEDLAFAKLYFPS
jgi:ubiquinone/menaquinone biosynthesis C-methylase UbiE